MGKAIMIFERIGMLMMMVMMGNDDDATKEDDDDVPRYQDVISPDNSRTQQGGETRRVSFSLSLFGPRFCSFFPFSFTGPTLCQGTWENAEARLSGFSVASRFPAKITDAPF